MNKYGKSKNKKGWPIVVMDILLIGVALVVFSLFHHVLPREAQGPSGTVGTITIPKPTPANTLNTPAPGETPGPDQTPQPENQGQFGAKFADKFSQDGTVTHTENQYRSRDIYIEISTRTTKVDKGNVVYHVADIYIRNTENFKTRLAKDKFGQGFTEDVRKLTYESGGIIGLSGDMSSKTRGGIVIRNGVIYQEKPYRDVCVLYHDGTMVTYFEKDFNMEYAKSNGAYQAWDFGPRLLDDNGEALTEFNSRVTTYNPRSVIGYFEPGHYCFVAIDGRQSASVGMTMQQTAQLMHDLGCRAAFNLDGGQSAVMSHNNGDGNWENDFVNSPSGGGRKLSDILYIAEAGA